MSGMPVGFGIVGCGRIAHMYARACQAHPDRIRRTGAHDVDAGRTLAFGQEYGIQAFESLESLLADPGLEAMLEVAETGLALDIESTFGTPPPL